MDIEKLRKEYNRLKDLTASCKKDCPCANCAKRKAAFRSWTEALQQEANNVSQIKRNRELRKRGLL